MDNPTVNNQNDFKVVEFHNSTDFTFTPEMGCMYDGRPISGISGSVGIKEGETTTLPYHIAHRIAENLAKYVLINGSSKNPPKDSEGNPIIAAIWDSTRLDAIKNSYLKDLYVEEKPIAQTETDRLMAKVEEYKAMVDKLVEKDAGPVVAPVSTPEASVAGALVFQDKQDVIKELERLNIAHDKRKSLAELSKLLPVV